MKDTVRSPLSPLVTTLPCVPWPFPMGMEGYGEEKRTDPADQNPQTPSPSLAKVVSSLLFPCHPCTWGPNTGGAQIVPPSPPPALGMRIPCSLLGLFPPCRRRLELFRMRVLGAALPCSPAWSGARNILWSCCWPHPQVPPGPWGVELRCLLCPSPSLIP